MLASLITGRHRRVRARTAPHSDCTAFRQHRAENDLVSLSYLSLRGDNGRLGGSASLLLLQSSAGWLLNRSAHSLRRKAWGGRHKPAIKESEGENGDAEMKEREISQNDDLLPRNRGEPS